MSGAKIEFKIVYPKYGSPVTNVEVGEGVIVGTIYQPTQSKTYIGPRFRPESVLPGIRIRQGLLYATEEEARAAMSALVHQWFQRCGWVEKRTADGGGAATPT